MTPPPQRRGESLSYIIIERERVSYIIIERERVNFKTPHFIDFFSLTQRDQIRSKPKMVYENG
jgi:hypothetical protein